MALEINIIEFITLILRVVAIGLLLGLFNIYRKSYKEIRIGYTIGLLIFALLLIFKTTVELIISVFMMASGNPEVGIVMQDRDLLPAVIELIAISVLYKITKDY